MLRTIDIDPAPRSHGRFRTVGALLAGLLWLSSTAFAGALLSREGGLLRLSNDRIATTFNLASGEWEIVTAEGVVLATRLRCSWGEDPGQTSTQGIPTYSFMHVRQGVGAGTRIEITRGRKTAVQLKLTVYDRWPCVLAQLGALVGDTGTNDLPIAFEGLLYPAVAGADLELACFRNPPKWEGIARGLEQPAVPINLMPASTGLLYLGEKRQSQGMLVAGVMNLTAVRFEAPLTPASDAGGFAFKVAWTQSIQPTAKNPLEWESQALLFSAPQPPAQGAALLRQFLSRLSATPELDLPAAEALERITPTATKPDKSP
jgi:hypothetical protein